MTGGTAADVTTAGTTTGMTADPKGARRRGLNRAGRRRAGRRTGERGSVSEILLMGYHGRLSHPASLTMFSVALTSLPMFRFFQLP